ncbi:MULTISPECIES: hypothetical protein [Actinomycetes]|uniref:hypothetical protein n=1 Tax=Actinomycetes TaxID=1760 RepID=UPI0003040CB0|nr:MULTISPECIES: hypothetical protein [Nocardia]AXK90068.1 hypothetical protein DXT66_30220 [Nocardia farcinica]MBA4856820.1 hypothetical protein [Nocardia farcinica]MBC9815418.1 hypothetical protein [Nocardia farcinica]MBF6143668.1 hypothetical protein [Nocardia farcinica]MBF6189142.1 hypothetical protein [Nocardia farcinica]
MARKKLTIEFDKPLPSELYANIISATWMNMRAIADAANFEFTIHHDGESSLSVELNNHWDRFATEAWWDTE